jgi:hypothetical protein
MLACAGQDTGAIIKGESGVIVGKPISQISYIIM